MKKAFTNFKWNIPSLIVSLPEGDSAEALFQDYAKGIQKFEPNNDVNVLKYNPEIQAITGSNVFANGFLNYLLRNSGVRTSVPRDDIHDSIFNQIRNKYYNDFNALVAQKDLPSFEKNKGLWKKVIELAEAKKGSVKFPFMISGFYILPDKTDKDYGVKIISAPNFEIIEDERFKGDYNEWKFDDTDENGLPVGLNKNKGSRTFYTRKDGLSGVCLGRVGILDAISDSLAISYGNGRVVLVSNAESVANATLFSVEKMLKEKRDKLDVIEQKYLAEIKNI
jgi:hypothetical protein